jgi:hypothetical protein
VQYIFGIIDSRKSKPCIPLYVHNKNFRATVVYPYTMDTEIKNIKKVRFVSKEDLDRLNQEKEIEEMNNPMGGIVGVEEVQTMVYDLQNLYISDAIDEDFVM